MAELENIRGLVLDVDGVLTDGGLYWSANGEELRRFDVLDGFAIRWFQKLGGKVALLSGKSSPAVQRRADELHIDKVIQGSADKRVDLEQIAAEFELDPADIAAMGDDLPDLPMLLRVGLPMAPANAIEDVKSRCRFVSKRSGGHGAVRDAIEHILIAQERWRTVVDHYVQMGETGEAEEAAA